MKAKVIIFLAFLLCVFSAWAIDYTNEDAEELVRRLSEIQNKKIGGTSPSTQALLDQSYIAIAVSLENLPSIINRGLLNQHFDNTSTLGNLDPKTRVKVESALLRFPFVFDETNFEQLKKFLPKYGHVVFPEDRTDISHYGQVYLILKQEVKKRTTWTAQDSFRIMPDPASIGQYEIENEKFIRDNLVGTFQSAAGILRRPLVAQRDYKEAQVWGEVTVKDVESIILPSKMKASEWFIPFQMFAIEYALKKNLPIYVYDSNLKDRQLALENKTRVTLENYKALLTPYTLERLQKESSGFYRHPDAVYYKKMVKNYFDFLIRPFATNEELARLPIDYELMDFLKTEVKSCHTLF